MGSIVFGVLVILEAKYRNFDDRWTRLFAFLPKRVGPNWYDYIWFRRYEIRYLGFCADRRHYLAMRRRIDSDYSFTHHHVEML